MALSGQGHLAIGASTAGTSEYINAAVAGRLATDPPGTIREPVLYTNSTAAYNPTPGRGELQGWGDYSHVSLDPCDDMTMWAFQQFTSGPDQWGVAVAQVKAPPPPVVASVSRAVLPQGSASMNVTITGAPVDGEGFYDPGAGFGCRLRAEIDGGVVVNSVTYTSPTSITLNVSTLAASRGPRRLTIINPDGQTVVDGGRLTVSQPQPPAADLDGDGRSDLVVWRPGTGLWHSLSSGSGYAYASAGATQWGNESAGDVPLMGDVDGDGAADVLVWRAPTGTWYWLTSSTGYSSAAAGSKQWGNQSLGDVPMVADIDGDGKADLVVWRASTGTWHWLTSSSGYSYAAAGSVQWGNQGLGDVPLAGDFDGDGRADLAVWRASTGTWYWLTSSSGYSYAASGSKQWGNQGLGDVPQIGDLDGDGRSDLVVWRASTGTWYWLTASSGYAYAAAGGVQWGNQAAGDRPLLGDFDGDGRADVAVWRAPTGTWFWLTSSSGFAYSAAGFRQWGNQSLGDIPMLK